MKKRIIWSNIDINPEDWKYAYKEDAELNEDTENENNLWNYIYETLGHCLDAERVSLNKNTDGRILVIASLGLWDGRKQAYKILPGNIARILSDAADYVEWYSDGYNIKATASHHDGTNFYEYRVIREDRNIQNLLDAIYNGEQITRKKLNYYTKSLHPYVAKIYGW